MTIAPLIREGFVLQPTFTGSLLRVNFSGCADAEAQPLLGDYFRQVHLAAQAAAVDEVVVDIHDLYFINSSCFKAFVTWIDLLNREALQRRYRIRFLKDRELRWQTRSFDALHRMSLGSVVIEDWPGGGL
jgi:hypothetical protein